MAISYIGDSSTSSASATSATNTEPAGAQQDDLMIACGLRNADALTGEGSWSVPADFTIIDNLAELLGSEDGNLFIAYKVRGATAGSGYTFDMGSVTAAAITTLLQCWRGVDTTNPIDVSYVRANHYGATANNANAAAKAITTVTNLAEVVLYQLHTQSLGASGVLGGPSGYTGRGTAGSATSGARSMQSWSKNIATAGTETPGVFTHTGTTTTDDPRTFTIALRPASAAAGHPARRRLGGVYGCDLVSRDRLRGRVMTF